MVSLSINNHVKHHQPVSGMHSQKSRLVFFFFFKKVVDSYVGVNQSVLP